MSTIKVINAIHPSGSTNNIVNDASGNVTIGNNLTVTGTATVGGTAVVAVAPGTNGNVLTSNGTNWTSAAPGSLTLLATLTTTSGTTQAATGLATTYPVLICVFDSVTPSTSSQISIELSSTNGAAYGSATAISPGTLSAAASGRLEIWRANANTTAHPTSAVGGAASVGYGLNSAASANLPTNTASPINAIRFSISAGNFNGGTIYIYGWK